MLTLQESFLMEAIDDDVLNKIDKAFKKIEDVLQDTHIPSISGPVERAREELAEILAQDEPGWLASKLGAKKRRAKKISSTVRMILGTQLAVMTLFKQLPKIISLAGGSAIEKAINDPLKSKQIEDVISSAEDGEKKFARLKKLIIQSVKMPDTMIDPTAVAEDVAQMHVDEFAQMVNRVAGTNWRQWKPALSPVLANASALKKDAASAEPGQEAPQLKLGRASTMAAASPKSREGEDLLKQLDAIDPIPTKPQKKGSEPVGKEMPKPGDYRQYVKKTLAGDHAAKKPLFQPPAAPAPKKQGLPTLTPPTEPKPAAAEPKAEPTAKAAPTAKLPKPSSLSPKKAATPQARPAELGDDLVNLPPGAGIPTKKIGADQPKKKSGPPSDKEVSNFFARARDNSVRLTPPSEELWGPAKKRADALAAAAATPPPSAEPPMPEAPVAPAPDSAAMDDLEARIDYLKSRKAQWDRQGETSRAAETQKRIDKLEANRAAAPAAAADELTPPPEAKPAKKAAKRKSAATPRPKKKAPPRVSTSKASAS